DPLADVCELADRAAARFRDGERRQKRVAASAERRVPARGPRGGARARARRLAGALTHSRRRDRRGGAVFDLSPPLAARRPARQRMGAALGHAHVAAAPRARERAGEREINARPLAQEALAPLDADAPGLPRLLAEIPQGGSMNLREHLALHGDAPLYE